LLYGKISVSNLPRYCPQPVGNLSIYHSLPLSCRLSRRLSSVRRLPSSLPAAIVILFVLLTVWSRNLPILSLADEAATVTVNSILKRANEAMSRQSWDTAERYFQQALTHNETTTGKYIHEQLQWCRVNTLLEERYLDDSVAQQIQSTTPNQARTLLNQTIVLILENYYQTVDVKGLLTKSLLQLQAATENPQICRQYPVSDQALAKLRYQIKELRGKLLNLPENDISSLKLMVSSLRNINVNGGIGESWAPLELAYALTDNLDKYSHLLSPSQYNALRNRLNGSYVGTGLDLILADEYPLVFDVVDESPAQKAGVEPGDLILAVDGIECKNKTDSEISKLLTGKADASINIMLQRNHKVFSVSISRTEVASPSVRYVHMLNEQTGFLRVASFDHDTALEMRRGIEKLRRLGAKFLLIDLRSNGGGVMTSAIDAVRLFIDSGTIVTMQTADEKIKYTAGGNNFVCYRLPLALLVDEKTASSAEIFVAALQDHQRAVVIGKKTLGKAVVQTIFNLKPAQNALCITTAKYFPPNKYDFHQKGLIPDITLEKDPLPLLNDTCQQNMKSYLSPDNPAIKVAVNILH